MKAIVFAAGLGTRLRPLTDSCPKALVKVGDDAVLGHVIRKLVGAGIDEIVVNVHHFPDMVIDYLQANDNFGVTVHVSDERDCLLDTGGGILKARHWLDGKEPILIHNADILTDFPISEMAERHEVDKADVTLLVKDRSTSRYFLFDNDNRMRGWVNTSTGEVRPEGLATAELHKLAFGGVHIMSPVVFESLARYSADRAFSITPFYIAMASKLHIWGFQPASEYRWIDIGKPESLCRARELFAWGKQ